MTGYLFVNGIIFLIVGLRALFKPIEAVAIPYGLMADEVDAKNYLRSSAGGVAILAGAVQIAGSFIYPLMTPALVMVVTLLGGLVFGRLVSLVMDGTPGPIVWISGGLETLGLVLGVYWLVQLLG